MDGTRGFTQAHAVALALLGSVLMFLGWALAIVPTFRDLSQNWPVVLLGLIAFAVVLIPPGTDMFYRRRAPGQKQGLVPILISAIPAALLFIVAVNELPLGVGGRVLAIVVELVGMIVFLVAWGSYADVTRDA